MIDGADYGQYSGWTIGTSIIFYTGSVIPAQNIYHEFGHLLNNSFNGAFAGNLGDRAHYSDDGTYWFGGNGVGLINTSLLKNPGLYDPDWTPQHDGALIDAIQHPNSSPGEQWADMFANYIAGNINLTSTGGSDMYNTVEGYLRVRGLIP